MTAGIVDLMNLLAGPEDRLCNALFRGNARSGLGMELLAI
jgi:hypothetical protein